jgi:hypothetical protein
MTPPKCFSSMSRQCSQPSTAGPFRSTIWGQWDVASALMCVEAGFPAVATT